MRKLLLLVAVLLASLSSVAQRDNHFNVTQKTPGVTVADKVAYSQAQCRTDSTCLVEIDSSLSATPTGGSLPTPCANCTVLDWRVAGQVGVNGSALGAGGGGSGVCGTSGNVPFNNGSGGCASDGPNFTYNSVTHQLSLFSINLSSPPNISGSPMSSANLSDGPFAKYGDATPRFTNQLQDSAGFKWTNCTLTETGTGPYTLTTPCAMQSTALGPSHLIPRTTDGTETEGDYWYDSALHRVKYQDNAGARNIGYSIVSGSVVVGSNIAIASGTCTTAITVTATGVTSGDVVVATPATDPTGWSGFGPSASGSLYIWAYPTADTINFKICNNTASTQNVTAGQVAFNYRVAR